MAGRNWRHPSTTMATMASFCIPGHGRGGGSTSAWMARCPREGGSCAPTPLLAAAAGRRWRPPPPASGSGAGSMERWILRLTGGRRDSEEWLGSKKSSPSTWVSRRCGVLGLEFRHFRGTAGPAFFYSFSRLCYRVVGPIWHKDQRVLIWQKSSNPLSVCLGRTHRLLLFVSSLHYSYKPIFFWIISPSL